jgi:signal transduction histidine kinase
VAQEGLDSRAAGLHNTWPGRSSQSRTALAGNPDSQLDPTLNELQPEPTEAESHWSGWKLRAFMLGALLGCAALFGLARELASAPHIDASWRATVQGRIALAASADPALQTQQGKVLTRVIGDDLTVAITDTQALQRSSRWLVRDADRTRHLALHTQLAAAFAQPDVRLYFADGATVQMRPAPLGLLGLPVMFWVLCGFALGLYLVGLYVLLPQPSARRLAFAVMAACQAGNLVFIAVGTTLELGLPAPWARLDMPVRLAFDLITAAAMVNAACLTPRRLPGSGWIAPATWAGVLVLIGLLATGLLTDAWWWTQGGVIGLGLLAIGLLSWSYQIEPHPFAIVLQRFAIITIATWALMTAALAAADQLPDLPHNVADIASLVWFVFFGSVLLLAPFLTRSQNFLREFAMLAAICTVATSLDLLFVGVLAFNRFSSLALALFISLALYAGARHWILSQLLGSSMLTTERMFEQLYRVAREVEAQPQRTAALLAQLLGELFEPLEVDIIERRSRKTRVATDGSSLLVPVPLLGGEEALHDAALDGLNGQGAVLIRFAQRGRRLFTAEDARLTDRVVEQLRRAVYFDKAVEQGRREERLRLAQDLHDDIGARLLTLMYKAQSPEMEEYVRHTLQDLKTLTRGLAASNHRLSHASAEWKADLTHRLTAAHVALKWSFVFDDDILLTVVHWSALTRILRELVSNAIAHAQAQQLEIDFRLERDRIDLTITDDGVGRSPRTWSHGLGLGGVRKRVKQLGGEVEWREVAPQGIGCRVTIRELSARW